MRGGERAGGKEPEPQFSNLFDGDKIPCALLLWEWMRYIRLAACSRHSLLAFPLIHTGSLRLPARRNIVEYKGTSFFKTLIFLGMQQNWEESAEIPHMPLPHTCTASPVISITHHGGTCVTEDEPSLTRHNHSKAVV